MRCVVIGRLVYKAEWGSGAIKAIAVINCGFQRGGVLQAARLDVFTTGAVNGAEFTIFHLPL